MLRPTVLLAAVLFAAIFASRGPLADAASITPEGAAIQGDVNCSASVDSIDSLQILRSVAGLSTNA